MNISKEKSKQARCIGLINDLKTKQLESLLCVITTNKLNYSRYGMYSCHM